MHQLKLYHRTDPTRTLETRTLAHGDLAIGRDSNAGWVIPDPLAQISRLHCILAVAEGKLTLRDVSANGVFIGDEQARAVGGERVTLRDNEKLFLGQFLIVVEPVFDGERSQVQIGEAPSLVPTPVFDAAALSIPDDWTAVAERETPEAKPAALESRTPVSPAFAAFCAGANLDARAFEGEDEAEVMRRVGAIYQASVIGLSSLMNERQAAKQNCGMDSTTIRPTENNPFKFSATRALGVDILRHHKRGFVTGADAVRAAFVDVKRHLISMLAGSRGVLTEALDALNPQRVEHNVPDGGIFGSRAGAAWKEYERVYAAFRMEVLTNPRGTVDAAFRAAYERQLKDLKEADEFCRSNPKL